MLLFEEKNLIKNLWKAIKDFFARRLTKEFSNKKTGKDKHWTVFCKSSA